MSSNSDTRGLLDYYQRAKSWVQASAFAEEMAWQAEVASKDFGESDFLREYAWVILNSGFREAIIRKHFDFISLSFCDWQSAEDILENSRCCEMAASSVYKNASKLNAISITAKRISDLGFAQFKHRLLTNFYEYARTLPFIGPITVFHLAKNLGIDAAKPDRHLIRIAERFGFEQVSVMCKAISEITGDRVSVTDIILWRFLEQKEPAQQFS